ESQRVLVGVNGRLVLRELRLWIAVRACSLEEPVAQVVIRVLAQRGINVAERELKMPLRLRIATECQERGAQIVVQLRSGLAVRERRLVGSDRFLVAALAVHAVATLHVADAEPARCEQQQQHGRRTCTAQATPRTACRYRLR